MSVPFSPSKSRRKDYRNLDESATSTHGCGGGGYESFPVSSTSSIQPLDPDLFAMPADVQQVLVHDAESKRGSWDHQKDLDQFFVRIYEYHQKGGFVCMLVSDAFELFQFIFIVALSVFLLQCVDYDVLFANKMPAFLFFFINSTKPLSDDVRKLEQQVAAAEHPVKRTLDQALIGDCAAQFHPVVVICLVIAAVFWFFRLIRVVVQLVQYWDIRRFYLTALKV